MLTAYLSVSGIALVCIRSQVVVLDLEVHILTLPQYQGLYAICRYIALTARVRTEHINDSFARYHFCLRSDFYRFSPTGLIPGHPPGLSPHTHPAIVTPGIKQELIQSEINHRCVYWKADADIFIYGERKPRNELRCRARSFLKFAV